jgi:hypothetical protein
VEPAAQGPEERPVRQAAALEVRVVLRVVRVVRVVRPAGRQPCAPASVALRP